MSVVYSKKKILIFCSPVPCTKLVLNVTPTCFIARCKVLSNVCFVYLCKAWNCKGQCHEILRDLPSVCEKMWGVALVKAECSGVGGKFFYLRSIWCKQNMANRVFSDGNHKVKSWLSCSPDSLLLSVSAIASLSSRLLIYLNFGMTYNICILANITIFNKFSEFAKSHQWVRNLPRLSEGKKSSGDKSKWWQDSETFTGHSGQNMLKNCWFISSNATWINPSIILLMKWRTMPLCVLLFQHLSAKGKRKYRKSENITEWS